MGRAPIQGAPQRVSAHVVPKALSPFADEDEKTTIESGWEEEASTTVEQGEVAEKIRTLGLRPVTGVTGVTDEPTHDDQRANAALSLITPPMAHARLLITAGNDAGQEIEIIPGKSYTIGRAIDNDVVLTDIAVSRKHFDLRYENNAWVIADRGSGNGTVINGNIEDNPFMLANGDAIEIGNTTFRFDHPSSLPRNAFNENSATSGFDKEEPSRGSFSGEEPSSFGDEPRNSFRHDGPSQSGFSDEEEPSTVAGKPVRDELSTPPSLGPPLPPIAPRPKTIPPPAPLPRSKPMSGQPPIAYPVGSQNGVPVQPPQSQPPMMAAHPHPQRLSVPSLPPVLAAQVPSVGPHAPTMMPGGHQMPNAQQMAQHALANVQPTTIPGQGPPVQPSQPQMHGLPFGYPSIADHAQHVQHASAQHMHASAQHAKMLVVGNQLPRDATSTSHVPPTPYSGSPVMQPLQPILSRRAKLLLGGAGLTILAAIVTIGVIKGVSGSDATPEAPPKQEVKTPTPDVRPLPDPKAKDGKKDTGKKDVVVPKKDPPKDDKVVAKDPPKDPPKDTKIVAKDPPKDPPKDDKVVAKDPPKDPPKDPSKDNKVVAKDPPKDPPKDNKVVAKDPPKDPPKDNKVVAKDPPRKDPPKKDPPKKDPPKKDPPKVVVKDPPKKDPPKKDPPKVATIDTSGAKAKADELYRAKKFKDAASVIRSAAGSDSNLKTLAASYEQFGSAYNLAMQPSAPVVDAWSKLRTAANYDRTLGGVYASEIAQKRVQIAGKVAITFAARGEFLAALEAVTIAEQAGAGSADVTAARGAIEGRAKELLSLAKEDLDAQKTKDALVKLRQAKQLAKPDGPTARNAQKLLAANGG